MTHVPGKLKNIIDAGVSVLHVIKKIVKSYLQDSSDEVMYDIHELNNLLMTIEPENLTLKFKNAVQLYGNPLPLRPHFSALHNAQTQLIFALKKYFLDIDKDNLQEATEQLFLETIADILQDPSLDLSKINIEQVEDFFEELEAQFRVHFIRRVKLPVQHKTLPITSCSASIEDIPSLCSASHERTERPSLTPFAMSSPASTRTSAMFSPGLFSNVYDSDLEEEVEECIVDCIDMSKLKLTS